MEHLSFLTIRTENSMKAGLASRAQAGKLVWKADFCTLHTKEGTPGRLLRNKLIFVKFFA